MTATESNYIAANKALWNNKTEVHYDSDFYNVPNFIDGESSLKNIELELLGDISGLKVLHLQCHFGQDTISLERLGASVTGVDLSDKAISKAIELAKTCDSNPQFICCDLYDLPQHLEDEFDIVFTSYGTIGWLPDMDRWAAIISQFLKPGGRFIFAEFHPAVWMFDDNFQSIAYRYFNSGAIVETEVGTYADRDSKDEHEYVCWNHSISEVVNALIKSKLNILQLNEYDYSPYDCFNETVKVGDSQFRILHLGDKIPMVYAIEAIKK